MFKRKNWFQRMRMPLHELEAYYREQRKIDHESGRPFTGVRLRRALHPVLVLGLKVMHLFSGHRVVTLGDQRRPTDRPVIYAATHIGWDDIEMVFTAIGDHAYLFWGDPRESYQTMDGFLLGLNGVICCDTADKTDRHIGKETCTRWLQRGGNLLIFPEGCWNTTEALPVMGLFTGTAEMAIRTGADIIPVAINQYGKEYRIHIGQNIHGTDWTIDQKQALTDHLRNAMATLKWAIYETGSTIFRSSLPADAREAYKQFLLRQTQGVYSWEELCSGIFRPKGICPPQEAFAHFRRLIPCRENGFWFRHLYEMRELEP